MAVWDSLQHVPISWPEATATVVSLSAGLYLRRLLPPEERHRGKFPVWCLFFSLGVRLVSVAVVSLGAGTASGILNFLGLVSLAAGITGVAGMAIFDLALPRLVKIHVPVILRDLAQAVALFIVLMGILRQSGVNLLSLVTTSAILTAVIGLALQSTIANLFAGLSLQMDRTLGIGDWIQVGGRTGRISQINLRTTVLVTKDWDTVIVPNSHLLTTEVHNFSKPTGTHRMVFEVGFHYRHPPNVVKQVLTDAVREAPGVLPEPEPIVGPISFGDSAIQYSVRFWIDEFARDSLIQMEVVTRIWYAAQRAGLEIPYPIRTVLMTEMTRERETADAEREFLERLAAIARVDLFSPLEEADRQSLARELRAASFADGETIIRQGEPGDSLYVIHEGRVGVRLTVDGAMREVATLTAGEFFGEMSLVTGEPRTATVAARGDVRCWVIEHTAVRRLLEVKPKIAEDISAQLGARQAALAGQREGLSAEARARRAEDTSSALLARIRGFFHLG